ncbi:MAG: tRNA (adenosine(37)-N6)-threonylcarbamoyltransferase complex transferase subunit TsaD [Ignavibacteriae bacterium]|nr:tRNA (adenosine(37)-N6)-threonylcarbamoyltransferase complex transferase subunit TsaD [Ignavibacteriota bacterium]
MNILGIETSCDETSAAVLVDGEIKSNIISSQLVHRQYGGIVPELASRAHQQLIIPIVDEALRVAEIDKHHLDGIAVTYGPGLIGALLVGLNFAKSLSFGLKIPYVGINHMEAHMYANFIDEPKPNYPFLCLIVSGGHTQLVRVDEPLKHTLLGETLDDAAGEAYDKVGKMLGLGFPGGPVIDKLAQEGNPEFVKFPRSYLDEDNFEFSFSGIKTAVLYWLRKNHLVNGHLSLVISHSGTDSGKSDTDNLQLKNNNQQYHPPQAGKAISNQKLSMVNSELSIVNKKSETENRKLLTDLCASFQAAVVDVLVGKLLRASEKFSIRDIAVAGGVSANSELRRRLTREASTRNLRVFFPKFDYCTDNGAMIAMLGWMKLQQGITSSSELTAVPYLQL